MYIYIYFLGEQQTETGLWSEGLSGPTMGECKLVQNMTTKQGCELVYVYVSHLYPIKKKTSTNTQVQYLIKQKEVNKKKCI